MSSVHKSLRFEMTRLDNVQMALTCLPWDYQILYQNPCSLNVPRPSFPKRVLRCRIEVQSYLMRCCYCLMLMKTCEKVDSSFCLRKSKFMKHWYQFHPKDPSCLWYQTDPAVTRSKKTPASQDEVLLDRTQPFFEERFPCARAHRPKNWMTTSQSNSDEMSQLFKNFWYLVWLDVRSRT